MLDLTYKKVLGIVEKYRAPKRSESASFLIWYLINYYRLDELEAIDSVCDQKGDKGVDGIYVNEGAGTIDIFQSRLSQNPNSTIGDVALKELKGTLAQFASKQIIEQLIAGAGAAQVAALVERLALSEIIDNYTVRGVFLSNVEIDHNGTTFLKASPDIVFRGPKDLSTNYVSDRRDATQKDNASFDVAGFSVTTYTVDANSLALIAPVRAKELVRLNGISDQSLFSLNVRASLGNTKVNRDIVQSIKTAERHKLFPLFHNGITVIAEKIAAAKDKIQISNYFVVNGCQSLNSLYEHKSDLTDDLRILTKFIQVPAGSPLSETITAFSNNQNGVKSRDFKSNHPIQIRLQNEFARDYADDFFLEVKRGEPQKDGELITNEDAGLYLIAFDLKEPWTTHRKYQVFDDKYNDIFGRPEVTADRIVLCHIFANHINQKLAEVENQTMAKYVLTTFAMLYLLRLIFESNPLGKQIIHSPDKYVRKSASRKKLEVLVNQLLDTVMVDFNLETKDLPDDFDYRGKLRDKEYVTGLTNSLLASYIKDIKRKKAPTIEELWQ